MFMAQEKGLCAEEGLDVTLNYSKGSSDAARQLAAGNADWDIYMTCLQLGEGAQKALQGTVDLADLLSDEIVIKAWDGLDIDMAKAS
nr:ABC transporter substrate-binding protein [Pseudotabrizicola sediminis]